MAGTIITDKIQTENSFLTLNVGATQIATMNTSGIYSSSGTKMIGTDGTIGVATIANTAITGFINGTQLAANTVTGDKLGQSSVSTNNIISSVTLTTPVLTTPTLSGNVNSSSNSTIRFVSTNAYNGEQNSKIQWINENQNGVMAQISGIRETNSGAPGALGFYTSPNVDSNGYTPLERMRITSAGALCVGKTSASGTAAGVFLQPDGIYGFTTTTNASDPLGYFVNSNASPTDGFRFASFRVGTGFAQVGTITTNGSSSTAYNTSSDYRLKENILPMQNALSVVAQLKPVTYTWKSDNSTGQGFIAHELQEVVPDCVSGEKDAVETYTDEDGNEQTRIKPQGVDTSFLVATLTAAIQEQQAIIADLKARIEALEA
jgi:hypothetical protein